MTTRRLFWDPPPDTDLVGFDVFRAPATGDNMLLDDIIAGNVQPGTVVTRVTMPEYFFKDDSVPAGAYQFAVIAVDEAGQHGPPYQHPDWAAVVVDAVDLPPGPCTGGGIEIVADVAGGGGNG